MALLDLTPDELLSTTRAVRKRLDFSRSVDPALIRECVELALQAPTGQNRQLAHFVVVTDHDRRQEVARLFRKGFAVPSPPPPPEERAWFAENAASMRRMRDGVEWFRENIHKVPVFVIPCVVGRTDNASIADQGNQWGSILPAVWSFMLAARARGLGTCWTTPNLFVEQEFAEFLGIPFERVMQAAIIPLAHTIGIDFRPGPRAPLDEVLHWERW